MKREKLVLRSPPTGVQHMVCVGVPTRISPSEHTPGRASPGGAVATQQPHTSNRYSPPVVMWMVVGSARIMPLADAPTTLSGILANRAPTSKSCCLNIAGPHTGVATALRAAAAWASTGGTRGFYNRVKTSARGAPGPSAPLLMYFRCF